MDRLNLGCGSDIRPGYTNVDFRSGPGVDLVHDLSVFPWPWRDGSVEELFMLDFLEHFPYRQTERIVLECHRVLGVGGHAVVQVPDAEHVCAAFLGRCTDRRMSETFQCNRCGTWLNDNTCNIGVGTCGGCGQSVDEIREAAVMRLFGGQDYPGNFHYTMFDAHRLDGIMARNGFALVDWEEVEHQRANWNIKGRFVKRSLWA